MVQALSKPQQNQHFSEKAWTKKDKLKHIPKNMKVYVHNDFLLINYLSTLDFTWFVVFVIILYVLQLT